jgi:hypothetical protein
MRCGRAAHLFPRWLFVVFVVLALNPGLAASAAKKTEDSVLVYQSDDGSFSTYVPNEKNKLRNKDKEQHDETETSNPAAFPTDIAVAAIGGTDYYDTGNSIWIYPPPNYLGGAAGASHKASVTWDAGWSVSASFSGEARAVWMGNSPWNADWIENKIRWSVSGLNVSLSIPAGVTITGSGKNASWNVAYGPTWRLYNTFSNVRFSGSTLWGAAMENTGYFYFQWYSASVGAYSSSSRA